MPPPQPSGTGQKPACNEQSGVPPGSVARESLHLPPAFLFFSGISIPESVACLRLIFQSRMCTQGVDLWGLCGLAETQPLLHPK